MLVPDLVTKPDLDALPSDACFIYIPFENEGRLGLPQGVLSDVSHEVLDPKDFHLTLLMASQCSLEQMTTFLANLSPTMRFFIEVASLGTLNGLDQPALTWTVDPGPQLMRLQQDLYNAALREGMEISRFSDPRIFKPHISVAYGLSRDLEEGELPTIQPFRLEVGEFIIGRSDKEHVFRVSLPRGVMVESLIIERDERDIPRDISRDIAPDAITVTKSDLGALLRGETVAFGPMRRLMSLEDGPFTLKHGTHQGQEGIPGSQGGSQPGFTHGGAGAGSGSPGTKPQERPGQPGQKRKETGFASGGAKKMFGKPHHTPVELDFVPDDEDFAELSDTLQEWQGRAGSMVDGLLDAAFGEEEAAIDNEDLRMEMFDTLIEERIDAQLSEWYDIKNLEPETFPLPAERLIAMSDQEIDDELRFIADLEFVEQPTDGEISDALLASGLTPGRGELQVIDFDGNERSFFFGRDAGEIVTTVMSTYQPEGDYNVSNLQGEAEDYASHERVNIGSSIENYDADHFEDVPYVHVDWLAAKRSREGFGSAMMGEIFRDAARNSAGVYLMSTGEGFPFYESLGGNPISGQQYFWTPTQVESLAERVEEESISITNRWVTREDVNEVVFGADEPTMFGQAGDKGEEVDLEPLDGAFTMGDMRTIRELYPRPRPWKRKLKEQIEAFEAEQGMNQISPEDQAILDARRPSNIVAPDNRQQMLMGVQRSLEDMATSIIGSVYQLRHGEHVGQEGEEGRRGGSDPGFTHVPGSVGGGGVGGTTTPEPRGQEEAGDSDRRREFDRITKVLKRILGEPLDIEENPEDIVDVMNELENEKNDWQTDAIGILEGWMSDAESATEDDVERDDYWYREEGDTEGLELDQDQFFEMMSEMVMEEVDQTVTNFNSSMQRDIEIWYEQNGSSWEGIQDALGISPEEASAMSDDEIHNTIVSRIALTSIAADGYIQENEFETVFEVDTPMSSAYGDRDGSAEEVALWVVGDFERQYEEESITEYDIEQRYGSLPYIDPETGFAPEFRPAEEMIDPFVGSDQAGYRDGSWILVGRDGGEITSVLSLRMEGTRYTEQSTERHIEAGLHKTMELTEEEFRDIADDRYIYVGHLAGKRGGTGDGTELLLQSIRIAAENDAGLYGSAVRRAAPLYDKLGARWSTESGPTEGGGALFTRDDVQNAVRWMAEAGLTLQGAENLELAESSLTIRVNIWALGEFEPDDMPAGHFEGADRDALTDIAAERHEEWVSKLEDIRLAGTEPMEEEEEEPVERQEPEVAETDEVAKDDNQEDKATEEFVDYSEVADQWLRENFGPVMMTLNAKEKNALEQFRGNTADFDKFNEGEEMLGEEPEMDSMMAMVDDIMARSQVPANIMVYRGMEIMGQMVTHFDRLEGEVFQASGFTPASLKPDKALEFAEQSKEEAVVLEIGVPAGTNAIWMDFAARPMVDFELLLPEDLKFKIVETGEADEGKFIVAEIV